MEEVIIKVCDDDHGGLQVRRKVFEHDYPYDGEEYLSEECYIEEIHLGQPTVSVLVGRKEIPDLKKALTAVYSRQK